MASDQTSVEPLVTAYNAFPAMERMVIGASRSVHLSLHVFSSRTRTRSAEAHARGLTDWGQLLAFKLNEGVRIRLLINDFDPVGAPDLHASTWERIALLDEEIATLAPHARRRLTVMVAMPGGQTGGLVRLAVWPAVRARIGQLLDDHATTGRAVAPGLQEFQQNGLRLWPPTRNYTQSIHQKFIICDGRVAIVGGLDIDERRYDDPAHRRPAEQTWHDVSLQTDAVAARALVGHFAHCWRLTRRHGKSFCDRYVQGRGRTSLRFVKPVERLDVAAGRRTSRPIAPVAVTVALPVRRLFGFGPSRRDRSLEMAHFDAIAAARNFIYVETQFLRSTAIRDALAARMAEQPQLHLIMLLPAAPDAVAYLGDFNTVHRYGEWLQLKALMKLNDHFGERFGAFCLTNEMDRDERHERDALHGKAMVYVHSKVLIVDDERAIVSSANLNGRSMEWDFEAGVHLRDAAVALDLRKQLWHAHLGEVAAECDPLADPRTALAAWRDAAADRQRRARGTSRAGVVPFPLQRVKRFSKRHLLLPQQMV